MYSSGRFSATAHLNSLGATKFAFLTKEKTLVAYILHLIDTPEITSPEDAEKFISDQQELPPSETPKFVAFVKDITEIYPDLSDEDEDGDNDDNLWEEGIEGLASYGSVKELVVKTEVTDEVVMAALVKAAVKNGLKLYDSEGQVVYPEQ